MVDIRQLRYFATIVEKGSFTKASELLGIAQPSLGFQIRKLEEELQVQVLIRNSRGVQLTEPGRLLYERGVRIIAEMKDLERSLANLAESPHGPVSLGITPSLADRLLIPMIRRIREELPAVELSVTEEMSHNLVDLLEVGRLDIALVFNAVPARGLSIRRLGEDSIFLLFKSSEAEPDHSPVPFKEIAGYPLVLPRRPHRIRQITEDAAQQHRVKLNIIAEMQSLASILRMVESGIGATMIAGAMTRRRLQEGQLVARQVIRPKLIHDISLVHLDTKPLSRSEAAVADICSRMVSDSFE